MKIRVLGCHGGTAPGYRTTCYLINDQFLIDAGSVASALSPQRQMQLTDILITHPHIDHIKDLCFLIENTFSPERPVLTVRSTKEILSDIHKYIFNDIIWPDFTQISIDPVNDRKLFRFEELKPNQEIFGIKVRAIRVNHPGNAVGFILDDGRQQFLFSGDTGPTDELWKQASVCPNLKAVFTEISFPDRMDSLAKTSGHFTTSQLIQELSKLRQNDIPVHISHFKPLFFEELMNEFHAKALDRMILMHQEDEYFFD